MNKKKHKEFMEAQVKEALKFKKEQDKKASKDLGDDLIHQWIWDCSESFRKKWNKNH